MINAIDLAAKALRDGQDCMRQAQEAWDNGTWDREYVKGASDAIDDALAALTAEQSHVPPDRERLAKRLEKQAALMMIGIDTRSLLTEAASLLHRLSLPAVGEWRSIESAPKWEGECGPEVLIWDHATCIARQFAEWTYDHYHRGEKNPWVTGGGHVKHPTHWQPLPSPPSPEETGR